MVDYKREIDEAVNLLEKKSYNAIVTRCSWMLEQGLKTLYSQQLVFFTSEVLSESDKEEFKSFQEIMDEEFPHFKLNIITLGGLIKLFHITRMFSLIERRLDVRLTFSKQINWRKLKNIRNNITHDNYNASKEQAMDFIHYAKVFIYETKLIDDIGPTPEEYRCHECGSLIEKNWNFCPHCGMNLTKYCKKCNAKLSQHWTMCPECQTPRSGVVVKDPNSMYAKYCEAVWADGVLTRDEKLFLEQKRDELGIDEIDADMIEVKYAPRKAIRFRDMVEATLIDCIIDDNE
jgi:RNA polymerase subunit RPABC4/transcription elongation factor Spt4